MVTDQDQPVSDENAKPSQTTPGSSSQVRAKTDLRKLPSWRQTGKAEAINQQQEKTPVKQQEKTSARPREKTPMGQQETKTPVRQQEKTPMNQQEKTPIRQQEKTPMTRQEKTPARQQDSIRIKRQDKTPMRQQDENVNPQQRPKIDRFPLPQGTIGIIPLVHPSVPRQPRNQNAVAQPQPMMPANDNTVTQLAPLMVPQPMPQMGHMAPGPYMGPPGMMSNMNLSGYNMGQGMMPSQQQFQGYSMVSPTPFYGANHAGYGPMGMPPQQTMGQYQYPVGTPMMNGGPGNGFYPAMPIMGPPMMSPMVSPTMGNFNSDPSNGNMMHPQHGMNDGAMGYGYPANNANEIANISANASSANKANENVNPSANANSANPNTPRNVSHGDSASGRRQRD